ncbi:hypothetical protein EPA93_15000 [Ktedonosporobacter rubrisoli]|uniref:ABC transporter permease n=1 Tax=Ktedonosporobacter rubrisoli TaxID=2509675 RepID=A0A4P6JQ45_KTERU|nr:hypothetical protein EPA93_15000 [Ktedonosporobacter rubrisoli]
MGQTFVVISGRIDLSVGYVMGLSTVVAALVLGLVGKATALPLALVMGVSAALVVSVLAGLLNGWLIASLPVPPFIVTLGMLGIARGIGFILSPSG